MSKDRIAEVPISGNQVLSPGVAMIPQDGLEIIKPEVQV